VLKKDCGNTCVYPVNSPKKCGKFKFVLIRLGGPGARRG
jgi:hypothetical protein